MRKSFVQWWVLCVGLSFGAPASAVTLSTGMSPEAFAGDVVDCFVSNVNTAPITASVQMFALSGALLTPNYDGCSSGPIAPGVTCQVQVTPVSAGFMRCTVTASSSKVRANLQVYTTSNFVGSVPATK